LARENASAIAPANGTVSGPSTERVEDLDLAQLPARYDAFGFDPLMETPVGSRAEQHPCKLRFEPADIIAEQRSGRNYLTRIIRLDDEIDSRLGVWGTEAIIVRCCAANGETSREAAIESTELSYLAVR
jgi:hypothetical protein